MIQTLTDNLTTMQLQHMFFKGGKCKMGNNQLHLRFREGNEFQEFSNEKWHAIETYVSRIYVRNME